MKIAGRKGSISKAKTCGEIGDFWDEHDLSDYGGTSRFGRADVDLESEESLSHIERGLSESIRRATEEKGVSPHTLVNLWLQEKVQKLKTGTDRG